MTRNPIYPHADARSQWFANAHPGVAMDLAEMALVLHTTEGVGWWDYQGGSEAPTFTLWHGHGVRQHFPVNMSARALVNKPGGVQTNTQDAVQIELVGTCDRATAQRYGVIYWPEATDEQMSELAALLAWLHTEWGLKLESSVKWLGYPASAGRSDVRMSNSQWLAFEGVCGHQHVPENDHGDPGNFPIERLFALVRAQLGEASVAPVAGHAVVHANATAARVDPAATTKPFSVNVYALGVAGGQQGKPSGNVHIVQEALHAVYPASTNTLDGVHRSDDTFLIARFQREHGLAADGIAGPKTLAVLFALPVVVKALGTSYFIH